MSNQNNTTTVRRSLEWRFTEGELKALSRELATQNQKLQDLENQKKAAVAHYGSQMKEAEEQISSLSNKVTSEFEMRDVECLVEFHTPERNKKTFTRSDTGEQWVEPMSDADFNLFNQYEEAKEQEEAESDEVKTAEDEANEQEENEPKFSMSKRRSKKAEVA